MEKQGKININELINTYKKCYIFLYNCEENLDYSNLTKLGDELIRNHHEIVEKFNKIRGDILTSDREIAAFAMAFRSLI